MWFMPILMIINDIFVRFLSDFDMKKDIDTLIAEERAEIISKYDKVCVSTGRECSHSLWKSWL